MVITIQIWFGLTHFRSQCFRAGEKVTYFGCPEETGMMFEGFQGVIEFSPVMPRDARLLENSTYDRSIRRNLRLVV